MARFLMAALAATLLVGPTLAGGDAPAKKLLGSWVRKAGDNSVEFHFKANSLKVEMALQGARLEADADYGLTKDGYLFGRVSRVQSQGVDNPPPEGHLFSFRIAVKDGVLTVSEMKGTDSAEARQLIEGEYKSVKRDK